MPPKSKNIPRAKKQLNKWLKEHLVIEASFNAREIAFANLEFSSETYYEIYQSILDKKINLPILALLNNDYKITDIHKQLFGTSTNLNDPIYLIYLGKRLQNELAQIKDLGLTIENIIKSSILNNLIDAGLNPLIILLNFELSRLLSSKKLQNLIISIALDGVSISDLRRLTNCRISEDVEIVIDNPLKKSPTPPTELLIESTIRIAIQKTKILDAIITKDDNALIRLYKSYKTLEFMQMALIEFAILHNMDTALHHIFELQDFIALQNSEKLYSLFQIAVESQNPSIVSYFLRPSLWEKHYYDIKIEIIESIIELNTIENARILLNQLDIDLMLFVKVISRAPTLMQMHLRFKLLSLYTGDNGNDQSFPLKDLLAKINADIGILSGYRRDEQIHLSKVIILCADNTSLQNKIIKALIATDPNIFSLFTRMTIASNELSTSLNKIMTLFLKEILKHSDIHRFSSFGYQHLIRSVENCEKSIQKSIVKENFVPFNTLYQRYAHSEPSSTSEEIFRGLLDEQASINAKELTTKKAKPKSKLKSPSTGSKTPVMQSPPAEKLVTREEEEEEEKTSYFKFLIELGEKLIAQSSTNTNKVNSRSNNFDEQSNKVITHSSNSVSKASLINPKLQELRDWLDELPKILQNIIKQSSVFKTITEEANNQALIYDIRNIDQKFAQNFNLPTIENEDDYNQAKAAQVDNPYDIETMPEIAVANLLGQSRPVEANIDWLQHF